MTKRNFALLILQALLYVGVTIFVSIAVLDAAASTDIWHIRVCLFSITPVTALVCLSAFYVSYKQARRDDGRR